MTTRHVFCMQDQIFLSGKLSEYHEAFRCVCVYVCVRACVHACMHACVRMCGLGTIVRFCAFWQCLHLRLQELREGGSNSELMPTLLSTWIPLIPSAVDTGGNGTVSATELYRLFEKLEQPITCEPKFG